MSKISRERSLARANQRHAYLGRLAFSVTCGFLITNVGIAAAPPDQRKSETLEEVIVSAQKRQERLQDVPVPVTAIRTDSLISSNQVRLQDYYTKIPGLNVTAQPTYGGPMINIRGLATSATNFSGASVGLVVDDVPYTGAGQGLSFINIEIDPTDVAQIEVLRGPQGTLYGASSLGGLIKYVTIDPSTMEFSGRFRGGLLDVENGDGVGYNASAAVNVPLTNSLAIRASGFTRKDPGFVDDPVHNRKGVNSAETSGGRLAMLWRPSESFSLKVAALFQDAEADGNTKVTRSPGAGDLEQNSLPGAGGSDKDIRIYTANLFADLGRVDLTAISSYSDVDATYFLDSNPGGAGTGAGASPLQFGVTGWRADAGVSLEKYTEELRLEAPITDSIGIVLGGFYGRDRKLAPTQHWARNYATGALAGDLGHALVTTSFDEYAAFTDVTFQLTDRFDVQVGGRQSKYETTRKTDTFGRVYANPPNPNYVNLGPKLVAKDDAFTYLFTPRFKMSDDVMFYARAASGFRSGGSNTTTGVNVPLTFGPDETMNYDLGVKGSLFDGAFSVDLAVYYIDWKDIQITVLQPATATSPGANYVANAGKAESQGVELSIESRPLTGLTVGAWVAYNDAQLKEDLPPRAVGVFARAGDRLPFGSDWSGNVSLDQEFPISSQLTGLLGTSASYVGDRVGPFGATATAPRDLFPSYVQVDLRAELRFASWELGVSATNLTDKRAIVGRDPPLSPNFVFIQPRTINLTAVKTF